MGRLYHVYKFLFAFLSLLFFHNKRSSSYTIFQRVCFNAGLQIWIFISRHYIHRSPLIIVGRTAPVYQFWAKLLVLKVIIFRSILRAIVGFILTIITRWMVYLYLGLIDKFILKNNSFRLKAIKFYSTSKYIIVYSIPLFGGWFIV